MAIKPVKATVNDTKVMTGKVRASYANVFEARAMAEGQTPKYSICLIIPKDDTETINCIKQAIKNAAEKGKAEKFKGKIPSNIGSVLHDGDVEREGIAEYENAMYINASSTQKPGVVDERGRRFTEENEEDFYSGCYMRATLNFFPYNTSGNKGVGCGLNNIQKLEDGESLSGRASAESDFGSDESFSDDFLM